MDAFRVALDGRGVDVVEDLRARLREGRLHGLGQLARLLAAVRAKVQRDARADYGCLLRLQGRRDAACAPGGEGPVPAAGAAPDAAERRPADCADLVGLTAFLHRQLVRLALRANRCRARRLRVAHGLVRDLEAHAGGRAAAGDGRGAAGAPGGGAGGAARPGARPH